MENLRCQQVFDKRDKKKVQFTLYVEEDVWVCFHAQSVDIKQRW